MATPRALRILAIAAPAAAAGGTAAWLAAHRGSARPPPAQEREAGVGSATTPVRPLDRIAALDMEYRATPPPVATDLYAVEQVVLVHRHGDRAPIGHGAGAVARSDRETAYWRGTTVDAARVQQLAADFPVDSEWPAEKREEYDRGVQPFGQLTQAGAEQLHELGARLRQHYVDRLRVLPATASPDLALVRATFLSRVILSSQSLLAGLYPPGTRQQGDLRVEVSHPDEEPQFARNCPRLDLLRDALHAMRPQAMLDQWRSVTQRAFAAVGAPMPTDPWAAQGLREVLQCAVTHDRGAPVPAAQLLPELSAACADMYAHSHQPAPIARLTIGRVLGELLDEVALRVAHLHGGDVLPHKGAVAVPHLPFVRRWLEVRGLLPGSPAPAGGTEELPTQALDPPPRPLASHQLVVYGGHDSTLVPLLSALGVFDSTWPGYGAFLELLLLRDRATDNLFVRIAYRGRVVKQLPVEEFVRTLQPLVPTDYAAECEWPAGEHQPPRDHEASVQELHEELRVSMHTF